MGAPQPNDVILFRWTDREGLRAPVELKVRLTIDGQAVIDVCMIEPPPHDRVSVEYFYPPRFPLLPGPAPGPAPGRPMGAGMLAKLPDELLERIAGHLNARAFQQLHSTVRATHHALDEMRFELLELSMVSATVSAELYGRELRIDSWLFDRNVIGSSGLGSKGAGAYGGASAVLPVEWSERRHRFRRSGRAGHVGP